MGAAPSAHGETFFRYARHPEGDRSMGHRGKTTIALIAVQLGYFHVQFRRQKRYCFRTEACTTDERCYKVLITGPDARGHGITMVYGGAIHGNVDEA
jgi:hypothetical protein